MLILGFAVIAIMLVTGGVAVTSVQLARIRLYDTCDAAALDAADAIDLGAYAGGVTDAVPVADRTVRASAAEFVASRPLPVGVRAWSVAPGTGSPDGRTAVVRMQATATLPLVGALLESLGGSVQVTVESTARAGLDP